MKTYHAPDAGKTKPIYPIGNKVKKRQFLLLISTLKQVCYGLTATGGTVREITRPLFDNKSTAEGGSRTLTLLPGRDFESRASANSATSAKFNQQLIINGQQAFVNPKFRLPLLMLLPVSLHNTVFQLKRNGVFHCLVIIDNDGVWKHN